MHCKRKWITEQINILITLESFVHTDRRKSWRFEKQPWPPIFKTLWKQKGAQMHRVLFLSLSWSAMQ